MSNWLTSVDWFNADNIALATFVTAGIAAYIRSRVHRYQMDTRIKALEDDKDIRQELLEKMIHVERDISEIHQDYQETITHQKELAKHIAELARAVDRLSFIADINKGS